MPMDMHDDLSDADLKFLKKFGLLNDKDAEEARPPADIPTDDDEPDADEPQEEPVIAGPLDGGEEPAQPAEAEFEATMPEPASDGKRVRDQEAEDEGFDMAERDAEAEAHMEQIYADAEEEVERMQQEAAESPAEPEATEDEDEPADEQPAPEEPEPDEIPEPEEEPEMDDERDQQDEHHPIAYDIEGNDIFIGSKVVSQADGNFVDAESEPYVAMVLGAWVGDAEGKFPNTNLVKRILIVERLGKDDGDSEMMVEDGRSGWAVQSNLTAVVVDEETDEPETEEEDPAEMDVKAEPTPEPEEEEDEREPKADPPEARRQAYFLDSNGVELFDGDRVRVVSHQNFCDWPDEGIAEVVMALRNGTANPALLPQNFEDPSLGSWKSYDGQPSFAIGWGNTLDGLVKYGTEDERPEPKAEPQPEEAQPEPEAQPEDVEPPEDHPDVEPEPETDENQRKSLTKQQKDRFTNLATRIFTKAEGSFGKTKQTAEVGPLLPGGVFDGEEVAQVLEIRSNGVIYRVTLSAERYE